MFQEIIKFFLKYRILSIIGVVLIVDALRRAIQLFFLVIKTKRQEKNK